MQRAGRLFGIGSSTLRLDAKPAHPMSTAGIFEAVKIADRRPPQTTSMGSLHREGCAAFRAVLVPQL